MKTILTTLLILSCLLSNAQKWALPSSTWVCSYAWLSLPTFYTLKVEGDTLVEGVNCKIIGKYDPIITYESNDTVYFYFSGKFRATYYFNAQVGDTISFYDGVGCRGYGEFEFTQLDYDSTIVYATITTIDSITLANKFVKRFNCSIMNSDSFYSDTSYSYTEFIGGNYIYPYLYCTNIYDQEFEGICNYGDSTISGFYAFPTGCFTVSINELEANIKVTYNNPFSQLLQVEIETEELFQSEIVISNVLAQTITRKKIDSNITSFNTQNWRRGLYICSIVAEGRVVKSVKIVKE